MSRLRDDIELSADAAAGYRFAVVVSRFNADVTGALLDGARETFLGHGASDETVQVHQVPGAFELPMTAARLADGRVDGIVCLGALIRGETPHFDYLGSAVARGLADVSVRSGIPVIFGVLTCDSREQALDRAGGECGNKGAEAAIAAIEMVNLFAEISRGGAVDGHATQGA